MAVDFLWVLDYLARTERDAEETGKEFRGRTDAKQEKWCAIPNVNHYYLSLTLSF